MLKNEHSTGLQKNETFSICYKLHNISRAKEINIKLAVGGKKQTNKGKYQ